MVLRLRTARHSVELDRLPPTSIYYNVVYHTALTIFYHKFAYMSNQRTRPFDLKDHSRPSCYLVSYQIV